MSPTFTDRELDVMAVLWAMGSATVREVQEQLEPDLAYTTVLTMLRVLEAKGHVRHEPDGRAHRYLPTVAREEAGASALRRLLAKVFSGSPEALLTQLVSDDSLSDEELLRLRRLLDERLDGEVDR
ncbi:MAG: BlaI/MecI/CopY family transcriptional regulator [Gemmatimonadales bacterium]|jgi:predicted transcriptional regulator